MTVTTARRDAAVAARRAELLECRRVLAAGSRADVGGVLALARPACLEDLTTDLGRLRDRLLDRVDRARPRELRELPGALSAELAAAGERLDRTVAGHTAPDLRRLAARLCPGAPVLPVPGPTRPGAEVLAPAPTADRRPSPVWDPRLVGVLAGLPVLVVHGIGAPAALVVTGLVLTAGCLGRMRAVAGERARLRELVTRAVAAAGTAGEREVARRLVRTEAAVVAALDRAVRERRDRVELELAELGGPRGAAR